MNGVMADDIGSGMNSGALKVYENDSVDDFPILKAFQQYVEAEQTRARKRLFGICLFFCFLMLATIAVFVILLVYSTSRNQALNDRLVEYAMKDRYQERSVAVQPAAAPQDVAAVQAISKKLEDLRSELAEDRARSVKATVAPTETTTEKSKSAESLEIERLKTLLSLEKEKAAIEREKQRQAELEDYRRKHYPELYSKKPQKIKRNKKLENEADEADREIEAILNEDNKAIEYFDEEDDEEKPPKNLKDAAGNTWSIPLE